jgi:hypothetical protein
MHNTKICTKINTKKKKCSYKLLFGCYRVIFFRVVMNSYMKYFFVAVTYEDMVYAEKPQGSL